MWQTSPVRTPSTINAASHLGNAHLLPDSANSFLSVASVGRPSRLTTRNHSRREVGICLNLGSGELDMSRRGASLHAEPVWLLMYFEPISAELHAPQECHMCFRFDSYVRWFTPRAEA